MSELDDLKSFLQSQVPIVVVETREEKRILELFERLGEEVSRPVFSWSVTTGFHRTDQGYRPQRFNVDPLDGLKHIRSSLTPSIFILLDFHSYLEEALPIRLVREIAQNFAQVPHRLVFVSPEFDIPKEISLYAAKFQLSMPNGEKLIEIITQTARNYYAQTKGKKVLADKKAVRLLASNLLGLSLHDATRLARKAIFDDGAITRSDMKMVMEAKYKLINQTGVLSYEYDTAGFADMAGLSRLKHWLKIRSQVIKGKQAIPGLDPPKGVLLLGVQGCGKSLAAKAVAGVWEMPLLRLDFAALYDKYMGETEKNLRESLRASEVMAPCILWIDEIEKGLASGDHDDGVSKRVLGSFLTWMSEKHQSVFVVATCNDVTTLPPELLRKGRFDEIFFVDLPSENVRASIFEIQLEKRHMQAQGFDLEGLAQACPGFSGSEIEQAVVSALYAAHAQSLALTTEHILNEINNTKPLSVVMAEKVNWLRNWAKDRTVPAD